MKNLNTRIRHAIAFGKVAEEKLINLRGGGLVNPILKEIEGMVDTIKELKEKCDTLEKVSNKEDLIEKIKKLKRPQRNGCFRKGKIGEERDLVNKSIDDFINSL